MKELNQLKRRLLKQETSEKDLIFNLCEVMKIVGGYEQLMNLPIPALMEILKYLEHVNKEEQKAMEKAKNRGKR